MREKTAIAYSIKTIENFKKKFEENNNNISEKIDIIKREYKNMSNVLNTPNSSKIMPELYEMIDKYDKYVKDETVYFDKVFNTIITEYNSLVHEIKNKVEGGGNVDK